MTSTSDPPSSVSFIDPQSTPSPASSPTRLITKAHSRHTSEQTPSIILKQLTTSIPEKEYKMMYDWKVTQACITKVAHGAASDEKKKGGVVAPGGRRLSRMGTSKIHKFKPAVSMSDALTWLSEYGHADSTIVFENDCCLMFKGSSFQQLEDVRDEAEQAGDNNDDDDEGEGNGDADKRPVDDDDDDDEDEEQR